MKKNEVMRLCDFRFVLFAILATLMAGSLRLLADDAAAGAYLPYRVIRQMPVAAASLDFLTLDTKNRRLYGFGNYVVNIDDATIVGRLEDSTAHGGFVVVPELGRGVVRNGTIFDLSSGKTLGKLDAHGDASLYDPVSGRAFLFGETTSVIDVKASKLVGQIALGATPESGVADGRGNVYVNLVVRDMVAMIDARTEKILHKWSIKPCAGPMGMSMDRSSRRLFVACAVKKSPDKDDMTGAIAVLDADNGAVVKIIPLEGGTADQIDFDSERKLLFSPDLDHHLSIIHEDTPDHYSVVQILTDPRIESHKVAVDERTHRVFLVYEDTKLNVLGLLVLGQ